IEQQSLFGFSGKPERAYPYQKHQLLVRDRDPFYKVVKIFVRAVLLPFHSYELTDFYFQLFYISEPHINCGAIDAVEIVPFVDTRRLNTGAPHSCFVNIKLSVVKSSFIVQYGYHKFHGIMHFEKKTVITLYGKAR